MATQDGVTTFSSSLGIIGINDNEFLANCMNAATSRQSAGENLEAINILAIGLSRLPKNPELLYAYAVFLAEAGRITEARSMYQQCLQLMPVHVDALWNASELFRLNGSYQFAYECLKRFEELGEHRHGMYHRIASCLWHLNQGKSAEEYFLKALELDPDPISHYEYSLFLLSQGRYKQGFAEYAYRHNCNPAFGFDYLDWDIPKWSGDLQALKGATLFILPEQSIAIQLYFMAWVGELFQKVKVAGGEIIFVNPPPLFELACSNFATLGVQCLPFSGKNELFLAQSSINFCYAISDIPHQLNTVDLRGDAYLRAPELAIDQARQWVDGAKKIRIGIAWEAGGLEGGGDEALGGIDAFFKTFEATLPKNMKEGIEIVCLVAGPAASDISHFPNLKVKTFGHLILDVADISGLAKLCDIVISSDPVVSQLSIAMGITNLVLYKKSLSWHLCRVDRECSDRQNSILSCSISELATSPPALLKFLEDKVHSIFQIVGS